MTLVTMAHCWVHFESTKERPTTLPRSLLIVTRATHGVPGAERATAARSKRGESSKALVVALVEIEKDAAGESVGALRRDDAFFEVGDQLLHGGLTVALADAP
jgi:hypothetical protein